VLRLADESTSMGLKPWDRIEWMPFLQAFAIRNNTKQVMAIMDNLSSDEYITAQACDRLSLLELDDSLWGMLDSQYCAIPQ
jgi:hypothetical protein